MLVEPAVAVANSSITQREKRTTSMVVAVTPPPRVDSVYDGERIAFLALFAIVFALFVIVFALFAVQNAIRLDEGYTRLLLCYS